MARTRASTGRFAKVKPLRIPEYARAWARAPREKRVNPFTIAEHPFKPKGTGMAMDDAFGSGTPFAWAGGFFQSAIQEGVTFLGYPLLASMAQRAEYRRISETIATEMTRKWVRITNTGDDDKTDEIDAITTELDRLGVRDAFRQAALQDGFFGRSHIYLDTGDTDNPDELLTPIGTGRDQDGQVDPASKAKITKKHPLRALRCVEAVWAYPLRYNSSDPLRADWYEPTEWHVMGKQLHATRLLTFIGREVPDLLKPAYSFGGLSLSQMAKPYVDNWLRTRQSVSDLIHSFSVSGLKTKLDTLLQPGGESALNERAEFFVHARDNRGFMLVDKDTEEYFNVDTSLASLPELQAQSQEHMAAVSGIPLVKLLGIQPSGLNADSEGIIRSFYDWIHAYQELLFRKPLQTIVYLVQLYLFGDIDEEIGFVFEPLQEMSEAERLKAENDRADMHTKYVNLGAIDPQEVRAVLAGDEDNDFAGLDPDDMPEPPQDMEDPDIAGNEDMESALGHHGFAPAAAPPKKKAA